MLNTKLAILLVLVLSFGLMTNAYAHKVEVVGDYKIEVGWDVEPPIKGINNKITLMITHISQEGKTASKSTGVSGLESALDVTITLSKEKTALKMIEDEITLGLYKAELTPLTEGYPIVLVYTELEGKPIEIDFHPERVEDGAIIKTTTSDGSIGVEILATAPKIDRWMLIKAQFKDGQGNLIEHVNYDIVAIQNGKQILSKNRLHSHDGQAEHITENLISSDPVDIQVEILGVGLPDDEGNWGGPKGQTISVNVVPEFGAIAMLVLAATIIIVVMTRSKIMLKL